MGEAGVSLESMRSQLPLAQSNSHTKVTHFGEACSEPLRRVKWEVLAEEAKYGLFRKFSYRLQTEKAKIYRASCGEENRYSAAVRSGLSCHS